jgi:hypothetical protein
MIDKKNLSERDISSKFITPAVEKSGWYKFTQLLEEVSFNDGKTTSVESCRPGGKRNETTTFYTTSPTFRWPFWQSMMGLNSRATAQININATNILLFPIPLPTLSEQHRIVQKLHELMKTCKDLEASIQQSVSLNEKLLQQVLREARKGVAEPGELNRQSFSNPKKEKSETTDL